MSRAYGTPTAGQLEKINALARRPLSAEDVFVFADKAVGDGLIPTRLYRAHKSLIEVFKADAKRGVSLMIDHAWASFGTPALSYGRTFDATLKKTMDNSLTDETWALFIDHYIARGREKNGISTDQLIADIEDGVAFDTSIGFGNDNYECSICGEDYMDYSKCKHFRGQEYEGEICTVILKPPGYLMENSIVFDGAYPGAGILSAISAKEIENNLDPVEDLKGFKAGTKFLHIFSENRGALTTFALREPIKGIVVPDIATNLSTHTGAGEKLNHPGKEGDGKDMLNEFLANLLEKVGLTQEQAGAMKTEEIMATVSEKLSTEAVVQAVAQAQADAQTAAGEIRFALTDSDIRSALGTQTDEVSENWATEMVRFCKEGREARTELINDALEWGIRAHGNSFARESYKEMLSEPNRSIQAIKDLREQFKNKANEELAVGRVTQPVKPQGQLVNQTHVPAEAYKVSRQ